MAAFAGVPFEVGDGHGSGLFPTTMFRVGHVDAPRALAAVGEFKAINDLMDSAREREPGAYDFPREGAILRPQIDPREWRANVTQIRNAEGRAMNGVDARELSDGEVEGRRQIVEYFRFLKAEVPGFEQSAIVEIAPQVGIRETRRIEGAVCADRRGHPVVGALRRQHRHQRLADGDACATARIEWALSARRRPTPTTSCPGACWCRAGSTTCWWPAAAPR